MKTNLFILSVIASLLAFPVMAKINGVPNHIKIENTRYGQPDKGKSISAQQAARIVKNKFGGKVLKVNNSGSKKNPSYRVKLLKDDGHVISVSVDGQSGRISGN